MWLHSGNICFIQWQLVTTTDGAGRGDRRLKMLSAFFPWIWLTIRFGDSCFLIIFLYFLIIQVFAFIWFWHCVLIIAGIIRLITRTIQFSSSSIRFFLMKTQMHRYLSNNKHAKHIQHYVVNCRLNKGNNFPLFQWCILFQHWRLVCSLPDEQEHEQKVLCWIPGSSIIKGIILNICYC